MFQRLDQLQTGSLFILTGLPGAGKSHLAASARRSGTIYILDTEGAAQNLLGKPGIHADIRAVQTLSLKRLLDAMREIKRAGQPGDTVILDSISKVVQAMRSYAQQRAGADTDRKASLSYDEHASVNRNMQAIYTGLTELKHAGFHVIVIGHLARRYTASGSALQDAGVRVLADGAISYEADAVLLVERNGVTRTVTPITKPPRPPHLQLDQGYPAELATLYPELAAPDLSLLVAQLGQERERVRRLGGDVPPLTARQARAMTQAELERAIDALRAQGEELERAIDARPPQLAGAARL